MPCGIEACPSAHYWSRKLEVLGHTVKLIPPSYVKAYLKRSKNDANDAAAICEAVTRDRTRPMLQQRQKVLARAPSTRDPGCVETLRRCYDSPRDSWGN